MADKEWLSKLVSVIESSDKIGGVTGKLFYFGDEFGKDAVFCTWPKVNPYSATPYNFYDDEPVSKVDYLSGAAMLVKKEVIKKVGLLDPEYFLYFEETDWCARMIRANYDLVYVPSALAWHIVSASSSPSKKIFYMEKNRIRFALKNFDSLYILSFFIIYLGETLYVFFRDIKNQNFMKSKIRFNALIWNLLHIKKTLERRKKDMFFLRKNGNIRSYNNSLPLRSTKIPHKLR